MMNARKKNPKYAVEIARQSMSASKTTLSSMHVDRMNILSFVKKESKTADVLSDVRLTLRSRGYEMDFEDMSERGAGSDEVSISSSADGQPNSRRSTGDSLADFMWNRGKTRSRGRGFYGEYCLIYDMRKHTTDRHLVIFFPNLPVNHVACQYGGLPSMPSFFESLL